MPVNLGNPESHDERANDAAIIARILAGDEQAARRFYDQHLDFVWSVVARYGETPDDVHDFAQDAFVRIFTGLRSFRGDSSLRTWLFRVSSGSALDGVRRRVRQRRTLMRWWEPAEGSPGDRGDPHLRARIAAALSDLSDALRDVFLMFEVHGLRHDEIATALGIPEGTSKSRLSAARDHLRRRLKDVWEERHE